MSLASFRRAAACAALVSVLGASGVALAQDAEADADAAADVEDLDQPQWGVGLRIRPVTVPNWLIELFVDDGTSMTSVGYGIEAVRRRGNFDMVIGFEYESVNAGDGYYLEKGKMKADPGGDAVDYVEFDGLALMGLDFTFLWHAEFTRVFAFRAGAGIGAGLVLGKVWQTSQLCTADADLESGAGCTSLQDRHESDSVPPVIPIVNFQAGFRFRPIDKLSINLDGGFRDMFYVSLSADYFF
jgi:hypothetical protein